MALVCGLYLCVGFGLFDLFVLAEKRVVVKLDVLFSTSCGLCSRQSLRVGCRDASTFITC